MSARKAKPLAILEAKVRQLMLMVGFGFMALIAGSMFSASLLMRVRDRLIATDSAVIAFLVLTIIDRLWILAVFPLLIHLASRFLELPLWRTAIIGALTGEAFYAAIQIASWGTEEAFGDWVRDSVRLGTLATGVCLTVWAGRRGRAWADERQKVADQAAAGRKSQYDEFLAASTALADRRDAAAAGAAPGAATAAAVSPEPEASAPAAPPPVEPKS